MAKIVENVKGFKVIYITLSELSQQLGGIGMCDYCNKGKMYGYLICVLNQWYCPRCYAEFMERAVNHPQDLKVEENNFEYYKKHLKM